MDIAPEMAVPLENHGDKTWSIDALRVSSAEKRED
jgi:hypothetical protein